jgi:hypothetical protein
MSHPSPAATRFHDVVVIHEQLGVRWRAGKGMIDAGSIVLMPAPANRPPVGLLDNPSSTFTISALDAGGRARTFQNVTFDRTASQPKRRYVFR